jgi:MFS family permease
LITNTQRICLAAFFLDAALMVGLTALPFFVFHHLGGSAAVTGGIGSAQSFVYAAVCLGSSMAIARVHNAMGVAVAGALLFTGLFVGGHLTGNLYLYCGMVGLSTAGMSLVWPALHSWLGAKKEVALRTRAMGNFNIAWSLGLAVGALVGGWLYVEDPRLPFVAVALLGGLAAALIYTVPSREPHAPEPETPPMALREREQLERLIPAAWVANGVGWAMVITTRMVFPKQLDDLVEVNALRILFENEAPALLTYGAARVYGALAFTLSTCSCVLYYLMGRTQWWHGRSSIILVLQLLAALSVWTLGVTQSLVLMALSFALIGVNCGFCFFASSYYCTANPALTHRRMAINEGVVGAGGFAAPFAIGYIADAQGIPAAFKYAPAVVALLILVQVVMIWRARSKA